MNSSSSESQPDTQFQMPKISVLSKGIIGTYFFFWLLTVLFPSSLFVFALIPAYTVPPSTFFWNVLTCSFIPNSIFSFILIIFLTVGMVKKFEAIWGSEEVARFILLSLLLSGIAIYIFMIIISLIFWSNTVLAYPIFGEAAFISSFLVAMKQLFPEQPVRVFAWSPRAKTLPVIFIIVEFVFSLISNSWGGFLLAVFGSWMSWVYLRFYQKRPEGSIGDTSDDFEFATFFPESFQPQARNVGENVYRMAETTGLFHPSTEGLTQRHSQQVVSSTAGSSERPSGPSGGRKIGVPTQVEADIEKEFDSLLQLDDPNLARANDLIDMRLNVDPTSNDVDDSV